MKKPHIPRKPLTPWGRAALRGADWFVNTQVIQARPNWNANHGRFMYNVHIGTDTTCWGIGWTQARAVFCLLPAYARTGDTRYLEAAERGIGYIRTLQNLDGRNPRTFGAFHEETPHSRYAFPRDAIEVADALLQWWQVTGDKDALERAELFLAWFKRNAIHHYPGFGLWARGDVPFDNDEYRFKKPISCEMGCPTILAHAFDATGKAAYRSQALGMADSIVRNYTTSGGPLAEPPKDRMGHHTDASGIILNDDGGCVSLYNAFRLSGRRKYILPALRNAVYYRDRTEPVPMFSGLGSIANILAETWLITGEGSFRQAAERYARRLLRLQVNRGSKMVRGAFRGEDEGAHWYVKGAANDAMVTTRVTAYAVLTLFKLDNAVPVRGCAARF